MLRACHCVKSVRNRSFSGPYFPAFGLNTENAGKCGPAKLRIRTLFTQCAAGIVITVMQCYCLTVVPVFSDQHFPENFAERQDRLSPKYQVKLCH